MQMIRASTQTHITWHCGTTSKRYLRLGDFDDVKFGNCVLVVLSKNYQLCLVVNSDQLLNKYPSSTEEQWPTEIVDYLSEKSVVVLDETKQL
ncbi:hypothetical protein TNCV_1959151 [Trichonephila clavipes]|nr:hypothetical protein TNCV_1959151 [Trichonephila clavipes]